MKRIAFRFAAAMLGLLIAAIALGAGSEVINWRIEPGGRPVNANQLCSLFNLGSQRYLVMSHQRFGVNLRFITAVPTNFTFSRASGTGDPLLYGETVALKEKGRGFLRFARRHAGVELSFSDVPVYEWQVRGGRNGEVVGTGASPVCDVSLFDTRAHAFLVNGMQMVGIHLAWRK